MGSGPRLPAPGAGIRGGGGERLTPGAPHNGPRHPPGDALPPPPQRAGAVIPLLSPHAHTAHARDARALAPHSGDKGPGRGSAQHRTPLATVTGLAARPASGRPGEGERLRPDAPRSRGSTRPPRADHLPSGRPSHVRGTQRSPGSNARHQPAEEQDAEPTSSSPTRTPPHPQHMQQNGPLQAQESHRKSAPQNAKRKTRPRSPTLDAAHEVMRALGLRSSGGDQPQEDTDTDSELEMIPEAPAGSAPAGLTPPAGSLQAPWPAWKRGHCTGEGWCPRQQPRPAADNRALPAVGHAAARAALRYGVAQGWIRDETTRGSVNIQEAVDRVAHTGQTEVALHTPGRHGGPAEGIVLEPTGMVLLLAADMVRGVLHASQVRRARPHWTIRVYTPPRAWLFSTWAVLAVMWHLTLKGTPTGTAEEIALDLHAWPANQDLPWRRPQGGFPVAPAAEGFSLAATLWRHPNKRACPFLQTGTVPAAPPDSGWRWDAGEA